MTQGLRERLIGTWKLVSYVEKPVDGSASFYPMGEEPQGIIMYTCPCRKFHPLGLSARIAR
jgi:hypothetical protein